MERMMMWKRLLAVLMLVLAASCKLPLKPAWGSFVGPLGIRQSLWPRDLNNRMVSIFRLELLVVVD